MATLFSITFNLEAALKNAGVQVTRAMQIGASRGINKTAASEKVALSRDVAQDTGLNVGVVKKAISVTSATASNLAARVVCQGERIPLMAFNARGPMPSRGRGQVTAGTRGARTAYPGAFIATVGPGHVGVFKRRGIKRLPIRELYGPSIAHVFEKMVPKGEARRQDVLVKNVQHEITFALAQSA